MNGISDLKKVSIIGAGAWGTSIAMVIADAHPDITICMWAYEKQVVSSINQNSENSEYLPGKKLQKNISAVSSMKESIEDSGVVIISTPSRVVPEICQKIKKIIPRDAVLAFLTKGFCKTGNDVLTISQAIERFIPEFEGRTVAVYGPSHAEEVSSRFHTCMSVASKDPDSRELLVYLLNNEYMQCRTTDDITGVELGGTLKNPAAIAAGIISVLPRCGDNLAGALISESLKEMLRISEIFNARFETIVDISGLGDLVATSLSEHSRNRRFGIDIANQILKKGGITGIYDKLLLLFRPQKAFEKMSRNLHYLAEGAYAIEPLIELAEKKNVSIPVYRSLYDVLLNKKDLSLLVETIKNPEEFDRTRESTKIIIKERKQGLEKVNSAVFREAIIVKTLNSIEKLQSSGSENCLIKSLESDSFSVSKRESALIEKIKTNSNDFESIRGLASIYTDNMIDRYKPLISYLYRSYISIIYNLKGLCGGKKLDINYIERADGTNFSENIIYLPCNCDEKESILFTSMIKKMGYSFPRFHVEYDGAISGLKKNIIRSAGGYLIQKYKLGNDIYRYTFLSYVATMLEYGIPVLFRVYPVKNREYAIQFFEMILKMMYENTVEVKVIPIKIDSFNTLINDPIALSDYTAGQKSFREISIDIVDRVLNTIE